MDYDGVRVYGVYVCARVRSFARVCVNVHEAFTSGGKARAEMIQKIQRVHVDTGATGYTI